MMILRRHLNRSRQVAIWVWNGKYHLLSLAAIITTSMYLLKILKFYPNTVALALSLTGLVIILAQQMLDAREFADHRPRTIRNWIKSYPPRNKKVYLAGTSAASAVAKAHLSVSVSKDASLDSKVDFLLRQVASLDAAIARVDDRVDEIRSSLETTGKKLQQTIDGLSSSIKNLIAGHVVGAYDLNLFGITITICGTLIQFFSV